MVYLHRGRVATPAESVQRLAAFLSSRPLTTAIAEFEHRLDGLGRDRLEAIVRESGVDRSLLEAAITVRQDLGRISDLIHAAAIVLVLLHVMDGAERITNHLLARLTAVCEAVCP